MFLSGWVYDSPVPDNVQKCRIDCNLTQVQMASIFQLTDDMWQRKEARNKTYSPCSFAEYNLVLLMSNNHPHYRLIKRDFFQNNNDLFGYYFILNDVDTSDIKKLRKKTDLNSAEFAELLNQSVSNWKKKESGGAVKVKTPFDEYNLILLMLDEHPNYRLESK